MRSPLGAYSEIVASVIAVVIVASAIFSRVYGFQDAFLDSLAALALGAVFGSTATSNGMKAGQRVLEAKLDDAALIAREAVVATPYAAATAANTERIADNTDPGDLR